MFLWLFIITHAQTHCSMATNWKNAAIEFVLLFVLYKVIICKHRQGTRVVQLHTQRHNFVWSIYFVLHSFSLFFCFSFSYKNHQIANNFMTLYHFRSSSSRQSTLFSENFIFIGEVRARQTSNNYSIYAICRISFKFSIFSGKNT